MSATKKMPQTDLRHRKEAMESRVLTHILHVFFSECGRLLSTFTSPPIPLVVGVAAHRAQEVLLSPQVSHETFANTDTRTHALTHILTPRRCPFLKLYERCCGNNNNNSSSSNSNTNNNNNI